MSSDGIALIQDCAKVNKIRREGPLLLLEGTVLSWKVSGELKGLRTFSK